MRESLKDVAVGIYQGAAAYLNQPPFHPATAYPEYPLGVVVAGRLNSAYEGVRETLRLLGLDSSRYGKPEWNPLGELVQPGDKVLLKPNLIQEAHGLRPGEWEQVITHGSVIRAVLDYVWIALKGKGRIMIADGPQTDADFQAICERSGLAGIIAFYREQGVIIELLDLRRDRWFQRGDVIYKRISLPGDPAGYTTVDLAGDSEFSTYGLSGNFYGADYDMDETASFHSLGHHKYTLCRSVMDADVVINLPKMKTHKKAGVTLSLKNMVGINGYRNCLPHHTLGTPDEKGDEFPFASMSRKIQSRATVGYKRVLKTFGGVGGAWARAIKQAGSLVFGDTNQVIRSGNWYGNDTIWRMVLDLNKALFYFDGDGQSREKPLRYMTFVDGIIAGEGNGPASPDPVECGLIVAGFNPVAVDNVCTVLMGFDGHKIPVISRAWNALGFSLVDFEPDAVSCHSNLPQWTGSLTDLQDSSTFHFEPYFGWKGHIEYGNEKRAKQPV